MNSRDFRVENSASLVTPCSFPFIGSYMPFVLVLSSLSVRNRKKKDKLYPERKRDNYICVDYSRFSGCDVEEDAWEAPPPAINNNNLGSSDEDIKLFLCSRF